MRRSLLNKQILLKSLRQALVLFTLLLLPSAAWGQTTYKGGTYADSKWGDWTVQVIQNVTLSDANGSLKLTVPAETTGTITLSLTQTKNVSEKICEIYVSPNSESVSLASAKIESSDGQTDPIDLTQKFLSNGSYRYYKAKTPDEWGEGKEIVITLNIAQANTVQNYQIDGAEVTTGTPYDLIVGGITVTNVNQDNVTGIEKDNVAEVIFTPETSKLALNSVELTSPIQLKNSMSSLTIDLQGTCSITTGNEVTISSESDANITFTSTSSTKGSLSLTRGDNTGLISNNITPTYNDELVAVIVNPTNVSTLAEAKEAVILESYGLTIAGVAVTSANVDSDGIITGIAAIENGTVKFTPAEGSNPAKLQLNTAIISYNRGNVIVCTSTSPLEVNLYYSSSIISGDYLPFEGATGDLFFTAVDNDQTPELTLKSTHPDFGSSSFSSGFNQVSYPKKVGYLSLIAAEEESNDQTIVKIREPESYGLAIGGVDVTEANANNISGENIIAYEEGKDSKVSFTPKKDDSTPAKLELKNAKITGYAGIFWGNPEELCIEISGNNSVEYLADNIMENAIWTERDANLTIKAANGADATLKLGNNVENEGQITTYTDINGFTTTDFTTLTKYPNTTPIKEGSYYYTYYTTYDVYDLWIGGTQVHAIPGLSQGHKDNVLGDGKESVKFAPESGGTSGTLTLENANIGEIISGLSSLTIHVIGDNVTRYIEALSSVAGTLTLEKEDANSVLTFDLTGVSIDSFIFGFTSFTNNDFTLFGFDSESSSPSALSGSFTYDTSNQSLKWSDSSTHLTKMVACILFEGEGTESSPYQIKTKEDLAKMSSFVSKGIITNQYFKVVNEIIDCTGLDFTPIPTFLGTFDGGGNTIKNLTFEASSSTNSIGLFSKLGDTDNGTDYSGTIKNLKLISCSFIGGSDAGAVVGELWTGTVQNCEVTSCTIQSGDAQSPRVGGIAGDLYKGIIQGCKVNNTTITASTIYTEGSGLVSVGGIVGNVYSECEVTECETTSITINAHHSAGSSNAGGIAGSFEGSTLKDNTVNGSQEAMTTISSKDTAENFTAGAIVGNVSTGIAMENNIYYYTVAITSGKGTSNENTKDKYTHRGTGSANYDANSDEGVKDPEGIAMYTKKVIIPLANNQQSGGNVGNVMVDLYYMKSGEDNTIYNVAPGEEIVLFVENYVLKGSYTLNGETEPITLNNTESNDWYSFDMPDADVTFTLQEAAIVHFSEEGEQSFATYYNATKDMAVPMGMTAYMVTGISEDGTKIIVSPVSYIKAGVAVLIEKDKTTEVSETTDFSGSKLVYAENDVPATENTKLYVLYNNKYVKVTAGTKILSGSCYLNLSGVANTRGFYEIGGGEGTTSLREVISEGVNSKKWADGEWYTLQGQRVVKPAKGLYILNGKKVVVK